MDDAEIERKKTTQKEKNPMTINAITRHMGAYAIVVGMNGIKRIQLCRRALDALDRRGWDRSFHQRLFHEVFILFFFVKAVLCFY